MWLTTSVYHQSQKKFQIYDIQRPKGAKHNDRKKKSTLIHREEQLIIWKLTTAPTGKVNP